MAAIRLIITEDNEMFLTGLHNLLEPVPGLVVCGTAENGQALLNLLKTVKADLILMDIQMPVMDGIQATARILKEYPGIKVMALSYLDDDYKLVDMIKAGCQGYVNKNASIEDLVARIRKVHEGSFELCKTTSGRIRKMIFNNELNVQRPEEQFTEMELKIIWYLCREYSQKEMMKILFVTSRTLKRMVRQIKIKCQADSTYAVIRYAIMHGLDKLDVN